MKHCFITFLLSAMLCGVVFAQAQSSDLTSYINELKSDAELKNSLLSIKIVNGAKKKTMVDYQSNLRTVPASVQKIITTGVGFIVLGKDYRFATRLAYSGQIGADSCLHGSLYIIGGGDPTLGSSSFPETNADSLFSFYLRALRKAGIKRIEGNIVANTSYFSTEKVHPSWEWEDLGCDYGAGTSGLSFCENAFTIEASVKSMNDTAVISYGFPFHAPETVLNKITPVSADSTPDLLVYSSPLSTHYLLSGTLPITGKREKVAAALQNPALACATQLKLYLEHKGVPVTGKPLEEDGAMAQAVKELACWFSPAFKDLAWNTNAYSNNVFADMILKHIGKQRSGNTDFAHSIADLMKLLKEQKLSVDQLKLLDGSGLSRQNLVTASFLCDYLAKMEQLSPDFVQSLPVPGERGTFQNFMSTYNTANRKRVRLKSGTMTGVVCYAGYVQNKLGERQQVAIMVNNFTCKPSVVRRKIEKLIYLITESN